MADDPDVEAFEERTDAATRAIIQSHIAQMAEHFDTVQVIVTRYCPQSGTTMNGLGEGNYYARIASAEAWVKQAKK